MVPNLVQQRFKNENTWDWEEMVMIEQVKFSVQEGTEGRINVYP
jgi:hypothetical protein